MDTVGLFITTMSEQRPPEQVFTFLPSGNMSDHSQPHNVQMPPISLMLFA